jgi:hypothetical protein
MPGLLPPFLRIGKTTWLYDFLVRNVRWGNDATTLRNYSAKVYGIVGLASFIVLFLLTRQLNRVYGFQGIYIPLAIVTLPFIVIDVTSIWFGVQASQLMRDELELVTLAPFEPKEVIEAQSRLAQTRTWRLLVVMQAVRGAFLIVTLLLGIYFWMLVIPLTFCGFLAVIPLALFEPIWRLEMMTAIGVMAGTRHAHKRAQLWGFGLMFAVWLGQGFLGLIPIFMVRWFFVFSEEDITGLPQIGVSLVFITIVIYFGQRFIREKCLQSAALHLANSE